MANFKKRVYKVIRDSDIVLEVLDTRFANETRNEELEKEVLKRKKLLVLVLNKADLVDQKRVNALKKEWHDFKTVSTSCKTFKGVSSLRNTLRTLAKTRTAKLRVGVIGYPNTGKSSLINRLSQRHAAIVGAQAGVTRGEQWIKLADNIMLLDTPGVLQRTGIKKAVFIGAADPSKLKDPELSAMEILDFLIENNPDAVQHKYGVNARGTNSEDLLEDIALAKNRLAKNNKPDTLTMSRIIIQDWQRGKLK